MNLALRLVALVLVILPLNLAYSQGTVNLAVIGEINVTLNDACQDLLLAEEVLAGDFDVDNDGTDVPLTDFSVIVEDGNEANGPIIDGCGTYSFRVEAAAGVIGFTTGWGVVNAEDKTPPTFISTPTPPAGPLYCTDVANVNVNLLPNTVSRCYRVTTATGNVVPGTLNNQLRDRLLGGGGLPVATDNCSPEIEICVTDVIEQNAANPSCGAVNIIRTFTVADGGCPSVSGEGNDVGTTTYPIEFIRPDLDDIDVASVPAVIEIECDELDGLGLSFGELPAPRPQDLPFLPGPNGSTIPLTIGQDGAFCNLGIVFEDSPLIITCDLAYKSIRTYTLVDWCNPADTETFTQIIKVGDFSAPEFTAPTQDLNFDGIPDGGALQFVTNAGNQCGAYIRLDQSTITLTDACSSNLSLSASIYPNGNLNATPFGAYDVNLNNGTAELTDLIPAGTHLLRYTYQDECDNVDFTDVEIVIIDGTPPVAICEDGLNVSLTAGVGQDGQSSLGIAVITPGMIDRNSFDDCSSISLAIGRVRQNADGTFGLLPGADYGPRVDVTCEDIGTVLVGLEITDGLGNNNYCWLSVLVEDKLSPDCIPPAPINLTCSEYDALALPADLATADDATINNAFGMATGQDNCSTTTTQTITGTLNSCGEGTVNRSFRFQDPSGNFSSCTQQVTIRSVFDYTISFPGDAEVFCMEEPDLADVTATEGACDLIIKDVTIDTFLSQADECYLLRLTHTVINFCEYNQIGEPYVIRRDPDGDGDQTERVFVHLLPGDVTTIEDDAAILDTDANRTNGNPIPFAFIPVDDGDDNDGSDDNNSNDSEETQAANGIGFAYAQDDSRGSFLYYQFIAVFDEVAPEVTVVAPEECFAAQSANCTGSVELSFNATDACTSAEQLNVRVELDRDFSATDGFSRDRFLLESEFSGNAAGDFNVSLANVPVGSHAIRVRVSDGCGNFNSRTLEFCVTDDLAPTPICIGMLTVTLMPNGDGTGNAAVWASDFIASDVEDCSGEVTYSIYTELEASGAGFEAVPGVNGIILDCQSDATVPVRVYAFDPAGRGDYCSVFVLVQRADNACVVDNGGNIGGVILSENGGTFGNVAVTLDGPEDAQMNVTGSDGAYLFQDLPLGDDYTISAGLDSYISHSQGVSTFDLVLITQHILGQAPLTSPYQLLAADVNNDQEITVQDLIAIRRLILGYDDAYPNSTAYRFVDENFIFPLNTNPWATSFPEVVNVNNLNGNVFDADFIGVMVGDVNGDGLDNLLGANGQPRNGAVALEADETLLKAGQTHRVVLRAGAASRLKGLQGTLRIAPDVAISGLTYGGFSAGDVNPALLERGLLLFSYSEAGTLSPSTTLLSLDLVAGRDVLLSDVLSFTDGQVYTEGYTMNDDNVNLAVDFAGQAVTHAGFSASNYPNPMREQTTIRFVLTTAGATTITVRDLTGRVLISRKIDGAVGANQTQLLRSDFGAAGVYTYTVQAGDELVTRKLIVE